MWKVVPILAVAGLTSVAAGDPVLTWATSTAGGFDVYTMGVQGDQGAAGWNIDVTFTGEFQQNLAYGSVDVNTESDANTYDGLPDANYEMATDCWYYDDVWTTVAPDLTDVAGTSTIRLSSLGSAPGVTFESADVMQFVVGAGTAISWTGVLSYNGEDYSVSGTVPDPTMKALELTENKPSYGDIDIEPEPADPQNPEFLHGTEVTLTAWPAEGRSFKRWDIFDPNYPGDVNYAIPDANHETHIVMNTDMHVKAVWQCNDGSALSFPLGVAMFGLALVSRKRWPRGS
jgi:hypothetical protein